MKASHITLRVFSLTFREEVVAAVLEAFLAVVGGNEASEGAEAGSDEDGELDHFVRGLRLCLLVLSEGRNLDCSDWMAWMGRVLVVIDQVEMAFYTSLGQLFIHGIVGTPWLSGLLPLPRRPKSSNVRVDDYSE